MTAAGLCATGATTLAVATSAGARRVHRYSRARFDVIVGDERSSGRRSRDGRSFAGIRANLHGLIAEAVDRAERSPDPAPLVPGDYDVVLEPHAVAELLEWLALTSLGARSLEDGSSALAGRAGAVLTGALTVYDDALDGADGCPSAPFDAEGTPRRRVVFLDEGRAGEVVHDRASAALAGTRSTGHAAPLCDELGEGSPTPQHLMLAAGAHSREALIGQVERGLYVARFHYVNGLLDTRRALMTGMTRDGLWRIENGRLAGPVQNQRWTESLLDAGRRVAGLGRERELVAGGLGESWYVCPAMLVRGWKFSG
jgi:predicted Zn-dependent protease